MSLKTTIEADLKTAMLAGDKTLVTTLRGLKSAILNVEVEKGSREAGLPDEEIVSLLQKEAKKRQESADLYVQGGSQDRADAELAEKQVIEKYLPAQLNEQELQAIVDEVVSGMGVVTMQQMGQVIGAVKAKAGAAGDGATIARLVKEKLQG
ncbi:MAG: GatB/YqeY domain-containing protein [Candidatus Saccharibacteria bacterium]|nr:GatB/YqeY domain-containing protein [Candidatus Saccharibacteria bacterium]